MSLDLHPEDLLDKWSRGSIAPDEKARLDEHLDLCGVCRFETKARTDFTTEGDVPQADLDALVSRALGSLASDKKAAAAAADRPARRRVPKMAFLLVAAFALLSVEALAGKWSPFHAAATPTGAPVLVETTATEGSPADAKMATRTGAHAKAKIAGADDTGASDDTRAVDAPSADSLDLASAPAAPVAAVAAGIAPVFTTVSAVTHGNATSGTTGSSPETASMIFARANKVRTAGDHEQARAAYATLFRRFPSSHEGMIAHATLGRMLLDDGDPSGALVELDAYLAQGDTALREPVLAARATALGRLGRKAAEAEAWSRLLDEYPSSLYASRAHARIEQSGGT